MKWGAQEEHPCGAQELMGFAGELRVGRGGLGKRRPLNLVAGRDTMGRVTALRAVKVFAEASAEAPQLLGIAAASTHGPRVRQFRWQLKSGCSVRLISVG